MAMLQRCGARLYRVSAAVACGVVIAFAALSADG
jgi:hypothetical protein